MNRKTAELKLKNSKDFIVDSISAYQTIKQLRKSQEDSFQKQGANILHSFQFILLCSQLEGFIHTVLSEYYLQIKLIKGLNKSFKNKNSKKILDGIIELYSAKGNQAKLNSSVLEYLIDGACKNITHVHTGKKLEEVFNLNVLKKYTGASLEKIPQINNTIQERRNELIHGKISYDRLGSTLTERDLEKLARDILKLCFKSISALENNLLTLRPLNNVQFQG
jgi:isoleucyl-tRNA synthetase